MGKYKKWDAGFRADGGVSAAARGLATRPAEGEVGGAGIRVGSFTEKEEALALVEAAGAAVLAVDVELKLAAAFLCGFEQGVPDALAARRAVDENAEDVAPVQAEEAERAAAIVADEKLGPRQHPPHGWAILPPIRGGDEAVGFQIAGKPDIHKGVEVGRLIGSYHVGSTFLTVTNWKQPRGQGNFFPGGKSKRTGSKKTNF